MRISLEVKECFDNELEKQAGARSNKNGRLMLQASVRQSNYAGSVLDG